MAIKFIQEKKKQTYLILIFVGVILITGLILWFGFFREEPIAFKPPPTFVLREIRINFDLLEGPFLKELQLFKKILPFEGAVGRENPFLPYSAQPEIPEI